MQWAKGQEQKAEPNAKLEILNAAKDLDTVVMVTNDVERKINSHFSKEELLYQEERRRRKVRRLDFEVR